MKHIIGITTNHMMIPREGKEFNLSPMLELIIMHSDGKDYSHNGKNLSSKMKFAETRMILTPTAMRELYAKLGEALLGMSALENTCDQINNLVKTAKESTHGK